jgi:dephospho-CoA kinase
VVEKERKHFETGRKFSAPARAEPRKAGLGIKNAPPCPKSCHSPSSSSFSSTNTPQTTIKMLLLGLTGSIATGKSTVSSILSSPPYSLPIIDADILARKVVEPGTPGYKAILAHFQSTTPDLLLPFPDDPKYDRSKGAPLNRPALGRRVFGDSEERKRDRGVLNGIVHPAVRREMYKSLLGAYLRGCWAVVLDVPLLFESGLDTLCGTVMVVAVSDPAIQMKRLRERDPHLSAEDAENRVKSQGDIRDKARRCEERGKGNGLVVWNDGDKAALKAELERVMREVSRSSPRWWVWLLLLCPPLAGLAGIWNYWRNWVINRRWREGELKAKAKL